MIGVIYKADNKVNGKSYIGQTTRSVKARLKEHLTVGQGAFSNALKKYGKNSFVINIIDSGYDKEDLNNKEIFWIAFFKSMTPTGYNLTRGGDGSNGHSCSEELKRYYSKLYKGIPKSEEFKQNLRIIIQSEETRRKRSVSLKGKTHTTETKLKISEKLKGKIYSQERIKKAADGQRGLKQSKETCLKKSISFKGRVFSEEHKKNLSKGCIERERRKREKKLLESL